MVAKKKGAWAGGIATILERTGMGMGKLPGVGIVGASIVGAGIEGAGWGDSHQRQELVVRIAGADERLALGVGIAGAEGLYAGIATCPFPWWQKRVHERLLCFFLRFPTATSTTYNNDNNKNNNTTNSNKKKKKNENRGRRRAICGIATCPFTW